MNSIEVITKIENSFPVEEIKAEDFKLWQFLRYRYYINNYFINENNSKSAYYASNSNSIFNLLVNAFTSFFTFRKKFKYILFTDSKELKEIDGKTSDKIAHNIISILGDDLLVSINSSNEIFRKKNLLFKNSINSAIFYFLSAFKNEKISIDEENILKIIENEFNISVDYQKKTDRFFSLVKVLDKYFKKNKFKIVFVNAYYSPVLQQAVIYSANKNNIKTVELQHGIINKNHIAYNISRKIGNDGLPQNIFLFGEYFKELLTASNFLPSERLFVTGSFYIDHSIRNNQQNKYAVDFFKGSKAKYTKTIAVTSQETIEKELIVFIKQAAALDKNVLYIFIPRNFEREFNDLSEIPNIIVDKKLDFYTCASFVDFHSTVYSTCAFESLAFGTANILINLNNLSTKFLGENLNEKNFSYFVNDPESMLNIINNIEITNKEIVKDKGNKLFTDTKNIDLKQIIKNIEIG